MKGFVFIVCFLAALAFAMEKFPTDFTATDPTPMMRKAIYEMYKTSPRKESYVFYTHSSLEAQKMRDVIIPELNERGFQARLDVPLAGPPDNPDEERWIIKR